ncbi:DUF2225 domain-containing protein [Phosphitispora sp. TUW77]|uniref:DUF2225 domain-containing protein n=1 Tax=Phosphitispora sp. TUW77 TaxID=3152361 RepID=UPI003AB64F57
MSANQYMRTVVKGTVLFQEKQHGHEMFIVLKGSVELSTLSNNRKVILAEIPQGGFFGEMSLLEGERRGYTAIASDNSVLLIINKANFDEIAATNPQLIFRIMQDLSSRIRDLSIKLKKAGVTEYSPWGHETAKNAGINQSKQPDEGQQAVKDVDIAAESSTTKTSLVFGDEKLKTDKGIIHDDPAVIEQYTFNKKVKCPVCNNAFEGLAIRDSRLKQADRTDELRVIYEDIEPLKYNIWICPECFYAMRRTEFDKINAIQKKKLANLTEQRKSQFTPNFKNIYTIGFAINAYLIAINCCDNFNKSEGIDERAGGIWLNIAWLYDDLEVFDKALEARKNALDKFKAAYMSGHRSEGQDQKIEYLIGRLAFGQKNVKEAREFWFRATSRRNGVALLKDLARDGLDMLKELEQEEKTT